MILEFNNKLKKVNIEVSVRAGDVPLSCPLPNMTLWDMHPKVFLATDENDRAMCPYCGTTYVLIHE